MLNNTLATLEEEEEEEEEEEIEEEEEKFIYNELSFFLPGNDLRGVEKSGAAGTKERVAHISRLKSLYVHSPHISARTLACRKMFSKMLRVSTTAYFKRHKYFIMSLSQTFSSAVQNRN